MTQDLAWLTNTSFTRIQYQLSTATMSYRKK